MAPPVLALRMLERRFNGSLDEESNGSRKRHTNQVSYDDEDRVNGSRFSRSTSKAQSLTSNTPTIAAIAPLFKDDASS